MSIIRPSFCHGIVDLFYCCFPQEIVKVGRHVEVPTRKEGDTLLPSVCVCTFLG